MITIINKFGRILELKKDTYIPVERYNSLFSDSDTFEQDITYPGRAGLTESNIIFIENGHLVETTNGVYQLEDVKLLINGTLYFAGTFAYKIVDDEIEFIMKVNLAALTDIMDNTRLTEIRTEDGIYIPDVLIPPDYDNTGNNAQLIDRMTQSCLHPDQYPYAYFPVYNELSIKLYSGQPWTLTNFVNFWKHSAQTFVCSNGTEIPNPEYGYTVQSPYFKLTYITKLVFSYLGLQVTGDFFSDPEYNSLYIYTRKTNMHQEDFASLDPSMSYMPNMLISDFLKQLRDRLRLMIDFDFLNQTARIRSSKNILQDPDYLDISEYVASVSEFGEPDKKGYRVFLAPDAQDELFGTISDSDSEKAPEFRMIVGTGTTDVTFKASTLKKVDQSGYSYPATKQRTTFFFRRVNAPELEENPIIPADPNDPTTINNWPLRLLKFSGMKDLGGGIKFPEALPYNLDDADAQWWRFRNDTKRVIINANLPVSVLEKLANQPKIGAISKQGLKFQAIYEKYSHQFTHQDKELIPVKIESYVIISDLTTPFVIEKVEAAQVLENTNFFCTIKAYFDTAAFKEVKIEAFSINIGEAIFEGGTIKEPTDHGGAGGGRVVIRRLSGAARAGILLSVKIQPRYLYYNGRRLTFTQAGAYWQVQIPWRYDHSHQSYWIVF